MANKLVNKNRIPLEERVVVAGDEEVKFTDMHYQMQSIIKELYKKSKEGDIGASVYRSGTIDVVNGIYRGKLFATFEILKSFMVGDILGRCDDQGRIIYRTGKYRSSIAIEPSFFGSPSGFHFQRESDVLLTKCDGVVDMTGYGPSKTIGEPYTILSVAFEDGWMQILSNRPDVITLDNNEGVRTMITDPSIVSALKAKAEELSALQKERYNRLGPHLIL